MWHDVTSRGDSGAMRSPFRCRASLYWSKPSLLSVNIWLIRDYWCLWLFLMFANTGLNVTSQHHDTNTCLYVTSQCHDVLLTLIAILCDSLCSNFGFPRTGLVEYIGVHRHQSIRKYNDLLIWKSPITLHAILLFHIYSFLLVYLCINL